MSGTSSTGKQRTCGSQADGKPLLMAHTGLRLGHHRHLKTDGTGGREGADELGQRQDALAWNQPVVASVLEVGLVKAGLLRIA